MRSLIERALEKSDRIDEFTAFPMLFQTAGREPVPVRGLETVYSLGRPDFSNEKVIAVWHTPETVELLLSNGMRVSIEIAPPTLAMRIFQASQAEDDPVIRLTLIRHDEDIRSSAQIVESRIRALRQLYAIGVLAQEADRYLPQLLSAEIGEHFDYEDLLEWDEKLILRSAGEGTFWTVVETAALLAKKAPKATLVFLTTLLTGGVARTQNYVDAFVQSAQAAADKATAEARGVGIQNEVAQKRAEEAATQAKLETRRQQIAANKEQVELDRAEFAAQKEKVDAFRDYVSWLDNVKDPEIREKMKVELIRSSENLIGPMTHKWLELPSPKN